MPDLFRFELTDLYDAKNVPKVWFCLHALSYILHKQDPLYPAMNNLVGKVNFSADDIRTANRALVNPHYQTFLVLILVKEKVTLAIIIAVLQVPLLHLWIKSLHRLRKHHLH